MSEVYPNSAGYKRKGTSQAAAPDKKNISDGQWAIIMQLRRRGPLTADEIASYLAWTVLYVRPRVTELRKRGIIEPTGETRANASGKQADVMRLK